MPTYDYECSSCGHRFEQFQQMSDAALTECPQCGGSVRRLIGTGGGIIFKGPGFHVNDYPSSSPACGRSTPCCGRDTVCDNKPCDD